MAPKPPLSTPLPQLAFSLSLLFPPPTRLSGVPRSAPEPPPPSPLTAPATNSRRRRRQHLDVLVVPAVKRVEEVAWETKGIPLLHPGHAVEEEKGWNRRYRRHRRQTLARRTASLVVDPLLLYPI